LNILTILNATNARASYPGGEAPVKKIVDFGCGHGRVTRWIVAAFPAAEVWVTDYDQTGVKWCVEALGCQDAGSKIEAEQFNLVWLGSVFTHLPTAIVEPFLKTC
jgi:trans-aconitate methyltransferase